MPSTTLSRSQNAAFVNPTHILVATDLTDSDCLVPHVVAQAKASGARVTLVHAVLPTNSFPMEAGYAPYPDERSVDQDTRLRLQGIARQIEAQGITCDIFFKHGFAAEVISDRISNTGATRLIMGCHGRGKWGQFALGSVANELLGSVTIPVFVVGPHASPEVRHATPRSLLHPVSFRGDYKKSAEIALDLAQFYKAELTLLHVLDPDVEASVNRERALTWGQNALRSLAAEDKEFALPVQVRAAYGNLVEEILHVATQTNPDWIVLGVDGGFPHLPFQNSHAYRVIASARCSVLTVRHDPREAEAEEIDRVHFSSVVV